ncbi:MAG: hypothetical protein ABIQ35_04885 [Verrucomicrobiota bacterium]
MKNIVTIALGLCLLGIVTTQAEEKKEHKRPALTEEQKKVVEKYDTNKDGKLDKDEYAKVSSEDKEKLPKRGAKKKADAAAAEKKTDSK